MVTDIQAIIDPSVVKPSRATVHHTAVVDDEQEGSEDQAGDGVGEGVFFDPAEFLTIKSTMMAGSLVRSIQGMMALLMVCLQCQ